MRNSKFTKSDRDWIDGFFVGYEAGIVRNVEALHEIDPESKEFMEWALGKLSNPRFFVSLASAIENQLLVFLYGNHAELVKNLKRKLRKGAREHGAPSYSPGKASKELKQEFLDLIGWNMVILWNQTRKQK